MDKSAAAVDRVFYDGHCGLCHWTVRFVLHRDRAGTIRFAPLDSGSFRAWVPAEQRAGLPDSIVVRAGDGRLLVRSAAILHILRRLGGGWGFSAKLAGVVPASLLDLGYDAVARVRARLFASPAESCPLVPESLRQRFDL
jgi:predicted DCC family thiol-disulfide oxidoreductase YuxK